MRKTVKLLLIPVVVLALAAAGVFAVLAIRRSYAPATHVLSVAASKKENRYVMPVKLIAHRGFSGVAPENTVAAVNAAGVADYFGVEFDLRLSADGEWFAMHDDDVSRMTDGEGLISEMTSAQIEKLTIDAGNNVIQYENEKIPTAREMLEAAAANGLCPIVEIKTGGAPSEKYKQLADLITELIPGEFQIISFEMNALQEMKKYLPDASLWLLSSKVTTEQILSCSDAGLTGVSFNANHFLNHRYIDDILDSGLMVAAWTVDNIRMLDRLYSKGVYFITTNYIQPA
ncbi:MAG: hypothetical protein IJL26_07370 [Clostridia bacterium]|nr:hypothetical protein [Clostridia bacterium]